MTVEKKGNTLVITLALMTPKPPGEGKKMTMVASSGGFMPTTIEIDGSIVKVSAMAGFVK